MGRFDRYIYSLKFRFFSSRSFDYTFRSKGPLHSVNLFQSPTIYFSKYSTCRRKPIQLASCSFMRLFQSSLPMNLFVTYGVWIRLYYSERVPEDLSFDSDASYVEDHRLESDIEKMHGTIIDKSIGHTNMEKALDQLGIPLSTPLVTGVLNRLRYDEKIAFRFFTWTGHQENYSHEFCAYNDMIDILSSTRYKVRQFRIVCDMLDYMKRHNKNTVPVEVLLTILRRYTEKYLTHVQKFAKKKRIRVKTQPEINAFNLLLDALCKCSLVEEAEGLFKKVQNKIKPNADTYNILFFGWCRVRNPTRGMKVLEDMIQFGHTPDSFTYNTAIDTFCKAGMLEEALELFEFMRNKGSTISSPTAKTYAIIIVALVQYDRKEDCFNILENMISSGCLPDVSTYKDIIEGMCLFGKIDSAYKFLEEMGNKGYPPDIVTYNCFLKVLSDNKNSDEALKLYGNMIDLGCIPSVQTYNMLISMFFKMADSDGAFETWHEMAKRGCVPDADSYCVMIDGLFSCNKEEDACFLLEEVMNKGIKVPFRKFDSILMHLSAIGNLQSIHRLSDHMRKFYNPAMTRRYALSEKRKSNSLRGLGGDESDRCKESCKYFVASC